MVKNPPSDVGDAGSIPGGGTKIPLAGGQLSPRATTTELVCCKTAEPMRPGVRATQLEREKTRTPQLERSLRATMKTTRAETKTRRSQKIIKKINKIVPPCGLEVLLGWQLASSK